jgi:hypothetical protein
MGSMHQLPRAYIDSISSLKDQGVCVKEKSQADFVYPRVILKINFKRYAIKSME